LELKTKLAIIEKAFKMTDESQSLDQTLDQTLNKTDFGHMINENKTAILIGAAIIVALIVGFSVYSSQSEKAYQESLSEAYVFEQEVLSAYNEDKIKSDVFIQKVKELPANVKGTNTIVPALFVSLDKLVKDGKEKEAITILENWKTNYSGGTFMAYFMGLKLAPLYEDNQMYDKAIDLLQTMISSKVEVVKARLYLDLGRIYLKKGNKEKANENFNFIISNYKDSEFAQTATLYLGK
jgi:predicted negative regulator of RcsB-dependent stress response